MVREFAARSPVAYEGFMPQGLCQKLQKIVSCDVAGAEALQMVCMNLAVYETEIKAFKPFGQIYEGGL